MTDQQKYRDLPIGIESFNELINEGCYFIDKTSYIKTILEDGKRSVLLITRPRSFGKTLFMTMLADFLRINALNPEDKEKTKAIFKDTVICKDKEFTDKYLGNYPIISISLKSVDASTYDAAYDQLADVITELVKQLSYLKSSNALSDINKIKFNRLSDIDYIKNQRNIASLGTAIRDVASCLYEHFKRQVIVLIDEYDVPLAKAAEHGFHEDMVSLISTFLNFMKIDLNSFDGSKPIYKIIMTGCLKVAKNSIFTGVNNLDVNTVVSENNAFSGIIGFTKDETLKVLEDYEMQEYAGVVKDNYDGYRFYDKEMFCPWDVIKFVADNYPKNLSGNESIKADNYWAASTSSTAVYEYLGYLTDKDTQKMQDLVDGKSISFLLNDSMNYDCLSEHNSDDFWSLLLHTGYLTKEWDKTNTKKIIDNSSNNEVSARIPNLEILRCFTDNIKSRFDNSLKQNNLADKIAHALLIGDSEFVQTQLRTYLKKFVSKRDLATKAPHENYYHGFLNGLFANCSKDFFSEYHSNIEAGDGYADIIFKDADGEAAVVIELKVCKEKESRIKKSEDAIAQIEEKHYAEPLFEDEDIVSIHAVGISFLGRSCHVRVKRLK